MNFLPKRRRISNLGEFDLPDNLGWFAVLEDDTGEGGRERRREARNSMFAYLFTKIGTSSLCELLSGSDG